MEGDENTIILIKWTRIYWRMDLTLILDNRKMKIVKWLT